VTLTTKTDCRQSSYVSYLVFTETYDNCLQSVLVVSNRVLSSLKHMMTAYSLFWWSASQQKIVFGLHWNIWWLPTFCFSGQRHNKRSYLVFTETYNDCLLVETLTTKTDCRQSSYVSVKTKHDCWPPKQTVGSYHMFQWRPNTIFCCDADHQNRL
jgi:hypothetical protein